MFSDTWLNPKPNQLDALGESNPQCLCPIQRPPCAVEGWALDSGNHPQTAQLLSLVVIGLWMYIHILSTHTHTYIYILYIYIHPLYASSLWWVLLILCLPFLASAKVWLLCTNAGTDDFSVDHLLINFSRLGGPACAGKVSSGSDWGKVFTRF